LNEIANSVANTDGPHLPLEVALGATPPSKCEREQQSNDKTGEKSALRLIKL